MPALSRRVLVFVLFISLSLGLTVLPPMPLAAQSEAPTVLIGAGDIALCDSNGDEQTADLIEKLIAQEKEPNKVTVFTLGDNAYPSGSAEDYANCYDPTWGRFKDITRPAPGNHDLSAYHDYFGDAAGDPETGYYSYETGAWHIIVLNSNIAMGSKSDQVAWLRNDLVAHPTTCTLAMWHHPRFSSGTQGNDDRFYAFWSALYDAKADVVLNGHAHLYERFAPQSPDGESEPTRGIREFIVGTGGGAYYGFSKTIASNSEKRLALLYGVLKLTLYEDSYDWQFVPVSDDLPGDSGHGNCVK